VGACLWQLAGFQVHQNDAVIAGPNYISRLAPFGRPENPFVGAKDERRGHRSAAERFHQLLLSALRITGHAASSQREPAEAAGCRFGHEQSLPQSERLSRLRFASLWAP